MQKVVVTGISGNLGQRLARQLGDARIIGIDFAEPPRDAAPLWRFNRLDLGQEDSCHELTRIFAIEQPQAVVHLAFVIDPVRTGVLDVDRMWRINVAGTARVMEAIQVYQRRGGSITKFIFPSSVSAYGPDLPHPVKEDAPLQGHTLPYAVHKREADLVVQKRAGMIAPTRTYILRPHLFAGATMQNYLIGTLRGTPGGKGPWGERLRKRGTRLPVLLPWGKRYLENRYQFVHVDDVARLIAHILGRQQADAGLTILNVGGRGEPVTIERMVQLANQKLVRLPSRALVKRILKYLWDRGATDFPPEAFPYLVGNYTMDLTRMQHFLGADYESVLRFTIEEALADSFAPVEKQSVSQSVPQSVS